MHAHDTIPRDMALLHCTGGKEKKRSGIHINRQLHHYIISDLTLFFPFHGNCFAFTGYVRSSCYQGCLGAYY